MKVEPKPIVAGKTKPVEVKFKENSIHDIDMFAFGEMNYNFEGVVPTNFNGDTLALMFPRGFEITGLYGYESGIFNRPNTQFVKKWYFVWQLYQQTIEAIMTMWKWEDLPPKIKWFHLENILQRNGKIAMVRYQNDYVVAPFSVKECDVYDDPDKIKLEVDNKVLREAVFERKDFVIIMDNPNGTPLFNSIIPYIEELFQIEQQKFINLFASAGKGVFVRTSIADENGEINQLEMSLNDISQGARTFYTLNVGQDVKGDLEYQKELFNKVGDNPLFFPIQFDDRADSLIKQYSELENRLKQRTGLNQDLSFDNRDRLVASEVGAKNTISELIKQNKIWMRETAIKEINEKFGLNVRLVVQEVESDEGELDRAEGDDYAITE